MRALSITLSTIYRLSIDYLSSILCLFLFLFLLIVAFDSIFIKYYASVAGYCVLAAPLLFNDKQQHLTTQELTRDYIRYTGAPTIDGLY